MAINEKIAHVSDVFKSHYDNILSRFNQPKELSIDFLPDLDKKIWGLKKRKLVIVGGRPSQGKSDFLLQLGWAFARQSKVVYFFSFEMSKEVCVERLFNAGMEIDNWETLTGLVSQRVNSEDYNTRLNKFYGELKDSKFILIESIGRTLPDLDKILTMLPGMKPDVVIIDYGNLVDDAGFRSRKEGLDNYIKGFRALAIHNDFCAIMGAQINRSTHEGGKIKEPEIWQLKETGELEQVADMIFLLHWQYFYDRDEAIKNDYIINIAKNRDGRTAKKKIYFYPQWCKFADREEEKGVPREDYTQKY